MSFFPNLAEHLDSLHDALPPSLQAYFTRQNIQLLLRVVVIISTYTLFRPHLESLFRKATGTPDQREEEIKARVELARQQRDGVGRGAVPPGGVGAGVGVVGGQQGTVYRVVSTQGRGDGNAAPAQGTKGKASKGGKRKG
ncbi:hypothetical protein G647_07341 [Cladophialophora carrionii CBS 160.54]|uniref:Uncharacterized protein n=1 Tax=Cladophialophora carrionii CBS 160.54 TaxID=1279043 RepID=V9D3Z0_9EURO|nr:uncharacterized protein G647_07341 [Cladophialophora carrionii CBS 160.54]ETI20998.1 hypothetical protein G647_07341 [Cladophialophora carrionii CBS 160.54]